MCLLLAQNLSPDSEVKLEDQEALRVNIMTIFLQLENLISQISQKNSLETWVKLLLL